MKLNKPVEKMLTCNFFKTMYVLRSSHTKNKMNYATNKKKSKPSNYIVFKKYNRALFSQKAIYIHN